MIETEIMTIKINNSGTFDAATLLESLVDGVGVVDAAGEIVWMSARLAGQTPEVMRRFADTCRDVVREAKSPRASHLRRFRSGTKTFEVAISKLVVESSIRFEWIVVCWIFHEA